MEHQSQPQFLDLSRGEQRAALEALIFASEEPLTIHVLFDLLLQPSLPDQPKSKGKSGFADATVPNGVAQHVQHLNGTEHSTYANGTSHQHDLPSLTEEDGEDVTVQVTHLHVEPPEGFAEGFPQGFPEHDEGLEVREFATPVLSREEGLQLLEALVEELNADLEATGRAFRVVHVANAGQTGYQFATTAQHGELLARLVKSKSKKRLSQAALETLAIVAYRQPISKPELEVIRGVNSGEIINKLLEKNLVTIVGRSETVGKPLLYGTTDEFLKLFGLQSLEGLPKPRELEELMEDRADIIEAIQTAKDAVANASTGTKNTLTDTLPERTITEIVQQAQTTHTSAVEADVSDEA